MELEHLRQERPMVELTVARPGAEPEAPEGEALLQLEALGVVRVLAPVVVQEVVRVKAPEKVLAPEPVLRPDRLRLQFLRSRRPPRRPRPRPPLHSLFANRFLP